MRSASRRGPGWTRSGTSRGVCSFPPKTRGEAFPGPIATRAEAGTRSGGAWRRPRRRARTRVRASRARPRRPVLTSRDETGAGVAPAGGGGGGGGGRGPPPPRQRPHVLARARDAEAVAREWAEGEGHRRVDPVPLGEGQVGGHEAEGEQHLRHHPHEPALLGAGQEVRPSQHGPPLGPEVREKVLLEDLLARRVVVGARAAPGVVVRHEDDALGALAGYGEDVVEARRAQGPAGEALALDDDARPIALPRLLPAPLVLRAEGGGRRPPGHPPTPTP